MMNCPFCGCDLTRSRLNGERCPKCSALLVWDEPASDSGPANQAKRDDLPRAPVVEDRDFSLKEILGTLVGRVPFELAKEPVGNLPSRPPAKGEVPQGVMGDVQAEGASTSGSEAAVASPPRGGSGSLPPSSTPSPPSSPPSPPSSPPSPRRENLRTIDPRDLSPEQSEQLSVVWQPVIPADASPLMTLKSDQRRTAISDDLVILPRSLQRPEGAQLKSPDYRLMDQIGEGGVGIVYAARQASVNRTVAVKMLKPEIATDPDHRSKFLLEAVVTADLDHPNIVPIYELGADQSDTMFYSMKRVQGTPWSAELATKSTSENVDILMKVADAIAFAHSRGVVHRDLKPENIMLGGFGEVLVMDWGIALSTSAVLNQDGTNQSSSMGGTPAYMAPEMATGPITAIGECSDVYLLGAILFEIISGQPPHTGTDVLECLHAAARNEIVPTSKSGELLDIAYRALSTRPEDRYANVKEFQTAIRQYESHSESIVLSELAAENLALADGTQDYQDFARAVFGYGEALVIWDANLPAQKGLKVARFAYARAAYKKGDYDLSLSMLDTNEPEQARLGRDIQRAQEERDARHRRLKTARRMVMGLVAVVFVVVTVALLAVIKSNKETALALEKAKKKTIEAETSQKLAESAIEDVTLANANLEIEKATAETERKNAVDAKGEAEVAKKDAEGASYVAQIGLAAERIHNNAFLDALRLLHVYLDPTLAQYRKWEWGHLVYLSQLDRQTLETSARVESVVCSDDGRWLVAGTSDGRVRVWDRQSNEELEPLSHSSNPVFAVAISRDGRFVLSGGADSGQIQIWERSQDDKSFASRPALGAPAVGHPLKSTIFSLRFSADNARLVSGCSDGTALLWDWRQRSVLQAFHGHSGAVYAASVDPAGSHVVTASEDGTVRVWPVDGPGMKEQRIRFKGHQGAVYAADFAPDGQRVASAGRDGKIFIWDWKKALGESARLGNTSEEVILTCKGEQVQLFDFEQVKAAFENKASEPERPVVEPEHPAVEIGLHVLPGHSAEVRSLASSDRFAGLQGNFLVSCGHDNVVKVWNLDLEAGQDSAESLATFRGHGGWVRSAVFLRDDASSDLLIASGGHDRQVKIWDPKTYEEVREFPSQETEIADSSLSTDGLRAITAGRDGAAYVWDVSTGHRIFKLQETVPGPAQDEPSLTPVAKLTEGHEFLVSSAIFFPASDPRLLTSAGDGTVRLWNSITGGQLRNFEATGPNASMTLSDDGRWLLTGGEGNEAKLWDTENSQEPLATLEGHQHEVTALAISPGGELTQRMLFTGDASGNCKIWQWDSQSNRWECSADLRGHLRNQPITAAAFLPGVHQLLTASQDYTVMRWEVPSGKLLVNLTLKHPGGVRAMDVSPDGRQAVTVCQDSRATSDQPTNVGRYRLSRWDVEKAELLGSQSVDDETPTSIVLSRDNRSALVVAAAAGSAGQLYRWEFAAKSFQPLWNDRIGRGAMWAAAVSPELENVVTVGGRHARLWNEAKGELAQSLSPHGSLNSAAFSPGGTLAVTAGSDGAVKIWNIDERNADGHHVVWKFPAPHGEGGSARAVNSAVFGPRPVDGDHYLLTAGDDHTARLWRLGDGQPEKPIAVLSGHTGAVRQAVFSRDGNQIATASSDGTARIWDASDPDNVQLIAIASSEGTVRIPDASDLENVKPQNIPPLGGQSSGLTCVDFSPNGKRLVIGGEDNTVQIWDLEKLQNPPLSLEGHAAGITSVAFSPDGTRLVSGSSDGIAKVWDTNTGNSVLSLDRHRAEVTSVEFSAQGDRILTASNDGTAIVWFRAPIGQAE